MRAQAEVTAGVVAPTVERAERAHGTRGFNEGADFSGMSSIPLVLEFVKQKTFMQVDELGTTAGASSVTGAVVVSLSEFRVDHPFIFVIRERQTGTIPFMGKVLNIPTS